MFLRLLDQHEIQWECSAYFFGIAARLMRRILVDRVRARSAVKRCGQHYSASLRKAEGIERRPNVHVFGTQSALQKLNKLDPLQVRILSYGSSAVAPSWIDATC
jgi:hypothetical protein